MTTRGYEVNLDRLLTREHTVEVEVPTTTYAYDAQELSGGNRIDDGEWRRDSDTELAIGLNDSNGLSFPDDLTLPASGVEVSWDGAAATILTVTALEILRDPIIFIPLGIRLTFNATLPAPGTALAIRVPSGGTQTTSSTTEQKVWCGLRDFTGRDQINIAPGQFFELGDTRVIVRADGSWSVMDTFNLDGQDYTVRGIARVGGRKQYLELLSRGG